MSAIRSAPGGAHRRVGRAVEEGWWRGNYDKTSLACVIGHWEICGRVVGLSAPVREDADGMVKDMDGAAVRDAASRREFFSIISA